MVSDSESLEEEVKPTESIASAISALVTSMLVGLVLTIPFYLVVPGEPLAVNLSFWGIHAIMVNAFLVRKTFKSESNPESGSSAAGLGLFFALVFALVVVAIVAVTSSVNGDTKYCVFILTTLVGQSFAYWFWLRDTHK